MVVLVIELNDGEIACWVSERLRLAFDRAEPNILIIPNLIPNTPLPITKWRDAPRLMPARRRVAAVLEVDAGCQHIHPS